MNEKSTPSLIFSVFAEKAVKIKKAPADKGRGAKEISESGKVVGTHGGVFMGDLLFRRNYAGAKFTGEALINLNMNAVLNGIVIPRIMSLTGNEINRIPGSVIFIRKNHAVMSTIFAEIRNEIGIGIRGLVRR